MEKIIAPRNPLLSPSGVPRLIELSATARAEYECRTAQRITLACLLGDVVYKYLPPSHAWQQLSPIETWLDRIDGYETARFDATMRYLTSKAQQAFLGNLKAIQTVRACINLCGGNW
jgi:hypothetical protein